MGDRPTISPVWSRVRRYSSLVRFFESEHNFLEDVASNNVLQKFFHSATVKTMAKTKKVKAAARPRPQQGDEEEGLETDTPSSSTQGQVTLVTDLTDYEGISVNEKVDSLIKSHGVVMINRSWCLFSIDAIDFLLQLGVDVYSLEVDNHPQGSQILKYAAKKFKHKTYVYSLVLLSLLLRTR